MVVFFQKHSIINLYIISQSYNPNIAEAILVWAIPISFATTKGISFDFCSSCYLDVSVHTLTIRITLCPGITQDGFPHSGILD